jgi:hypothetical protein
MMASGWRRPVSTIRRVGGVRCLELVDERAQPSLGRSEQVACLCERPVSFGSMSVLPVPNGVSRSFGLCRLTIWRSAAADRKRSAAVVLSAATPC